MVRAASRTRLTLRRRESIAAYLFVTPWIIGLLVFAAGPIAASLFLSFTEWDFLTEIKFVGSANYVRMFTEDRLIPFTLGNTAYYTFIGVPLQTLLALLLALPLSAKLRGIRYFRTVWYVPSVTPAVAAAILWILIYHPDFGMANTFLELLRIPPQRWIFDSTLAKPSFIIMSMWGVGGQMVIFLAGLQAFQISSMRPRASTEPEDSSAFSTSRFQSSARSPSSIWWWV